jgi:DNA-binding NtrC family response regulator
MTESARKPRSLIIEDDDFQYEIYEEALADYDLTRIKTCSEVMPSLSRTPPDLIILDHILSRGELGLDYLPLFRDLLPFVPVVVVSGALEVHQQIEVLQGPRRAHYCLTKPVDMDDLRRTVEIALQECGEAEVVRQFEALERAKRVDAEVLFSRSSDRLSRQNEILKILRGSTGRPNISALARQFRVARRTIIRDLLELIRRGQVDPNTYPQDEDSVDENENP